MQAVKRGVACPRVNATRLPRAPLSPGISHCPTSRYSVPSRQDRPRQWRRFARSGGDGNDEEEENSYIGPLEGMEGTVEKMLLDNPALKSAIARISAASEKYEASLRQNRNLDQQAKQDLLDEHRAMAHAEVEAAKKRVRAAELRMMDATDQQRRLEQLMSRTADRVESVKAFTMTSLGGIAGLVPILFAEGGSPERDLLNLAATALSSGLYGITYRYAVGDGKNPQLKLGVLAAFWIMSTFGYAQSSWSAVSDPLSHFDIHLWNRIGLYSGQSIIVLLASTLALELSIRSGFIRYSTSP